LLDKVGFGLGVGGQTGLAGGASVAGGKRKMTEFAGIFYKTPKFVVSCYDSIGCIMPQLIS
jgi:hypothetical protein